MYILLILLWCTALVRRYSGPNIFQDNSRVGRFDSRLSGRKFPVRAPREFAGKHLICLAFARQTPVIRAKSAEFPVRRAKPMRLNGRLVMWLGAALTALAIAGNCYGQSVLTSHGSTDRSGNFIVPSLTWERARNIRLDPNFHPRFPGH